MAIFIASTKSITRSKGQSAVAAACYRAGDKIVDERYGKTQDYSKRKGVVSAHIIMPKSLAEVSITRSELWNLAERSENRKNSRVAREWIINLPHELDKQDRQNLAHDFTRLLADKFGVIADCAIHEPVMKAPYDPDKKSGHDRLRKGEENPDPRNHHAHILLTTRKAELNDEGMIILTGKSDCELSDSDRSKKYLEKSKEEVKEIRQLWETLANKKLAKRGIDLIDSRSYRAQGRDIVPQIKMFKDDTQLERQGIRTVVGDKNRLRAKHNKQVKRFHKHYIRLQATKDKRKLKKAEKENDIILKYIADNAKRTRGAKTATTDTNRRVEYTSGHIKWALERLEHIDIEIESRKRDAKPANQLIKEAAGRRKAEKAEPTRPRPITIRERIRASEQRVNDTKQRIDVIERGIEDRDRDADRGQEDFDRAAEHCKTIIQGRAKGYLMAAFSRPEEQGFDDRQLAKVNEFAIEHKFTDLESVRVFFSDYDNAKNHRDFISMVLHPEKERKTFSEAHQAFNITSVGKYINSNPKPLHGENTARICDSINTIVQINKKNRP